MNNEKEENVPKKDVNISLFDVCKTVLHPDYQVFGVFLVSETGFSVIFQCVSASFTHISFTFTPSFPFINFTNL